MREGGRERERVKRGRADPGTDFRFIGGGVLGSWQVPVTTVVSPVPCVHLDIATIAIVFQS